jgi:hypothetical protein
MENGCNESMFWERNFKVVEIRGLKSGASTAAPCLTSNDAEVLKLALF